MTIAPEAKDRLAQFLYQVLRAAYDLRRDEGMEPEDLTRLLTDTRRRLDDMNQKPC